MQLFFLCAIAVMQLEAGVVVYGGRTGSPSVPAYLNANNNVTITVELSGAGYAYINPDYGLSTHYIRVYEGSSTETTVGTIATDLQTAGALLQYD